MPIWLAFVLSIPSLRLPARIYRSRILYLIVADSFRWFSLARIAVRAL